MDDDWGASATAPAFSLFKRVTPDEAAQRGTYVDPTLYNTWSKADRRLYRRLKTEQIREQLARGELKTVTDLTSAFETLTLVKSSGETNDDSLDDLIGQVERLKVSAVKKEIQAPR